MIIRTGHSFRYAYGHISDVIERIKECGWSVAPICDRNGTFAFSKWTRLAKAANLKPIYGVELAVARDPKEWTGDYWSFFAIDELKDLHALILKASEGKQPKESLALTYKTALSAKGVIKIIGPWADLSSVTKNPTNMFFALSPATPIGLYREAKKKSLHFIATSVNAYPRKTDKEVYRIALGRSASTQSYPQHILTDEEWRSALWNFDPTDLNLAIKNRDFVFKRCNAKLGRAEIFEPKKKLTLRQMCLRAAKDKGVDLNDPIYYQRLDKELKLIKEKEFEDYFYIITDIIAWSKKRMIVGPARGSSAGSLVCYLLDITTVDPLKYDLIFERFVDINRSDLPDVDIDFSEVHREESFKYVEDHYGREHVARLGTVGTFQPKSILNAVGIALRIPQWRLDKVADTMIVRSSGDSRANQQLEDTLASTDEGLSIVKEYPQISIASVLEDHPTNAGQHAAGICITKHPILEYVAIDGRNWSVMCDKEDAADLNMLKIDMLGLTQLSIFERTFEFIGKPALTSTLNEIPLDDQHAFRVLNEQKYSGIFQFNGKALQSLAKQVTIERLSDIVALTALARPGPLASGGANDWVARRMGRAPVHYPHPAFKPYLEDEYGVVLYQEQVMRIGRELGDLTWEDVTSLRKAMSKSLGAEYFNQWGDRWKAGAIKRGIPSDVLNRAWTDLCQMGSWSFNKAHAVSYGLVSYYSAYLKAHYPVEFAAASLDFEWLPLRQISLLRELTQEGIKYKSVDPETSTERWTIKSNGEGKYLLGPLTNIKGIGEVAAKAIINARVSGKKLAKSTTAKLESAITPIDSIYPIADKIKEIIPNIETVYSMPPMSVKDVQCGIRKSIIIIGILTRIAPRDANDPAKVARRNGKLLRGPTMALNMFVRDDTDEMFVWIDRFKYETHARPILEHARVGQSIIAFKGTVPPDFRMLVVETWRYVGELTDKKLTQYDPVRSTGAGGRLNQHGVYDKQRQPGEEGIFDHKHQKPFPLGPYEYKFGKIINPYEGR